MRHAARVDATQASIVAALQAAGAVVWVLGLPVDLLIGIKAANGLKFAFMECKTPQGKRNPKPGRTTDLQERFFAAFPGYPIALVDGPEAALRALRVLSA